MINIFEKYIERYPDFPKKGIVFWDFTPLHQNPRVFKKAILEIKKNFEKNPINKIVAIEAKGFIVGSALAYEMKLPLILIRKPNLIPDQIESQNFQKEYGFGEYQIKKNILNEGDKTLIIYDILAEAGATQAAIKLVENQGANVEGCAYITELEYLHGREALKKYELFSLVKIKEK